MRCGVGLWTLRSTAARPRGFADLYLELAEDARLAERRGFDSLWIAEHHFWYDGWCPSAIVAAAAVVGATERLRAGTGVHVLGVHDPRRIVAQAGTLATLSDGRFELGVGLGYRDVEFDGFGVERRRRGARVDEALDGLLAASLDVRPWVGGMSDAAMRRAAIRGLPILLPHSLDPGQIGRAIDRYREFADEAGRAPGAIGVMRNVAVTNGGAVAGEAARRQFAVDVEEYSRSFLELAGRPAHEVPELLDAQLERASRTAVVGTAAEVGRALRDIEALGAELVVLQIAGHDDPARRRDGIGALADAAGLGAKGLR